MTEPSHTKISPEQFRHTAPRPFSTGDLKPYQQPQVSEAGPRQLNSMQTALDKAY